MRAKWIVGPRNKTKPKYPSCFADRKSRYWRDALNTTYKCTRPAIVRINGKDYCSQHAGAIALTYLVEGKT